jgi:hypothetical protein
MFFIKHGSQVCHVVYDLRTGAAPCGAKPRRHELLRYQDGRPTPNILEERPADTRLCKHCEKASAPSD